MKKTIACIFIFFAVSCNSNSTTESYYYLTEDEAIDVGYPYGSIVYKSVQDNLFSNIFITANILDFKQNPEFVTSKQQLDMRLLKKWINDRIKSFIESKGYNGERRELQFYNYVLTDTLLLKYNSSDSSVNYLTNLVLKSNLIQKIENNPINYWIINKSTDSLIGPLTKSEFESTRKELKIPDSLKLD